MEGGFDQPGNIFVRHGTDLHRQHLRATQKKLRAKLKPMINTLSTTSFVLWIKDLDKTKLDFVGGKGANLGELYGIEGIHVPDGFCVSTEAFQRIIRQTPINELLDQLSLLKVEDGNKIDRKSVV